MIDLKDLRDNPEKYQQACARKHVKFDVNEFLELDKRYREEKSSFESLRSEQNSFNKKIGALKGEEKTAALEEMKGLAAKVKEAGSKLREIEEEWRARQFFIPGIPLDEVPDGAGEEDNQELRKWGDVPEFGFKTRDHVELGQLLDIVEIERAVNISGARNYFLKGDGARLQHAVLGLARDLLHEKGYVLMEPPHIVNYRSMEGTSYFPGGEDQAYELDQRDAGFYLIGTSEVPVCAYHTDEILNESELPLRYAGYSPCYRREAGSYGKDTHGLYRIHQFYKVEQVVISKADVNESAELHRELLGNAEEMMQLLELPYRVVVNCTGDLGLGQAYKNDIEAWMPSREKYSETHSCSTFYDFQSRRLGIRYKNSDGKKFYCHTLNNTCIASPRILIPLLENNQNEDGSVNIPEALRSYMGGQEKIVPKS